MDFNGDVLVFSVNQQYDLEYYKAKAASTRAASIASKTTAATPQQPGDVAEVVTPTVAVSKGLSTLLEAPTAEIAETELTVAPTVTADSVPVVINAFATSESPSAMITTQQHKVTEAAEPISVTATTNESAERTVTTEASTIMVKSQPSTAALQPESPAPALAISIASTLSNDPTTSLRTERTNRQDGVSIENDILRDIMVIIDELVLEVIAAVDGVTTATTGATTITPATITPRPHSDDNILSNPIITSSLNEANLVNEQHLTPLLTAITSMSQLEKTTCESQGTVDAMGDDEASMNWTEDIKKMKMNALKTESLWLEKSLRERIQVSIFDYFTFSYVICRMLFRCFFALFFYLLSPISPYILIGCFILCFICYPNRFCNRPRRIRASLIEYDCLNDVKRPTVYDCVTDVKRPAVCVLCLMMLSIT